MAGLSSPGIGSGLDINGLITKLLAVEQQPLKALDKKEADYQAKLSAYGTLKGALSTLQTTMRGLSSPAQYNATKATVADSTVLGVATTATAKTGAYSVEVQSLAQSYKVSAAAVDDPTVALGTGTLTIDFGTYAYDGATPPNITGFTPNTDKTATAVTISSTGSSLNGIRDTINSANTGVTASIVNDGSGYRLVVSSSEGGVDNAVRIKVSADGDGNNTDAGGLSRLAYDPAGTGAQMTENQRATSAIVRIDGVTITKSSNTITDAIQGVTLNLLKTNVSSPTTLTVSRDTSGVKASVQSFVKAYNDLAGLIKNLDGYNAETKKAGVLLGDAAVRGVQSQLRNLIGKRIEGSNGGLSALSDLGVAFQRDGTLAIDSTKFDKVLADPSKNVGSLFATMGIASDSLVTYARSTNATASGNYGLVVSEVATRAVLQGSLAPTATITAGINDTLSLSVDGTIVDITIEPGNGYTATTLANEIQLKANSALSGTGKSVSVIDNDGMLRISSSAWGSTSEIQLRGGSAMASVFGTPDTRGRVIGSQAANTTITAGINDALSLTVDGTSVSIRLAAGTYTAASLAATLQTAINAQLGTGPQVAVSEDAGVMTIASASATSSSFVALNGGTAMADLLGIPEVIAAKGRNVAGTLGGAAATGSGQTLTGTSEASGLAVLVSGGVPGTRGTVSFNRGLAMEMASTIDSLLSSKGTITSRTDGITDSIEGLADQRTVLTRRIADIEKRYRAQFNALDSLVASMQQTSTYLSQQLASLSKLSE